MANILWVVLFTIPLCALLTRAGSILQENEDRGFYALEAIREIFITTALFALIGPPLGLCLILLPFLSAGAPTLDGLLLFLLASFAAGAVPSCLAGVTFGSLLPWLRVRSGVLWAIVIGAFNAMLFFLASDLEDDWLKLTLPTACGALAGFVLGKLCLRDSSGYPSFTRL